MIKFRIITIICFISCTIHAQAQTNSPDYVFPDTTWKYLEKPDTLGWNIKKLVALEQFVINEINLTGLMVDL